MSDPTFAVPDAVLDDLRARLQNTRWPSVVAGQGWGRGTDLDYLRPLVEYWRTGFDWRAQEDSLSRFTHERVQVSDLSLHQIHERAADPNARPVVLLHGWPDSFLRYTKALPLLENFHRVVPSLPGFGFSEPPTSPGWFSMRMADAIAELMTANGYDRFLVSGGDVDSTVAEQVARRHADRVTALHLTDVPYTHLFSVDPGELTEAERAYLAAGQKWQMSDVEYDPGADDKVTVPTGVTIFPKDLVTAPRAFADRFFNIVRWTELPKGGHFTAWEEPEAFAHELTALAQEVDKC